MLRRFSIIAIWACVLLQGCGVTAPPAPSTPDNGYIFGDITRSGDLIKRDQDTNEIRPNEAAVTEFKRVAAELIDTLEYHDRVRLFAVGNANALNQLELMDEKVGVGQNHTQLKSKLNREIDNLAATYSAAGGDGHTNILRALVNARPSCGARGALLIYGDGVEDGEDYSVPREMRAGREISFPEPASKYLTHCKIRWAAFGRVQTHPVTGREETLTLEELASLERAWRAYFEAAGVKPEDIEFI